MAVSAQRSVLISLEGEVEYSQQFNSVENLDSPGSVDTVALSSGANTITPPTGATGCTIVPLTTNSTLMTLKGVSGDTGIALALTSPTSLGLNGSSTFVINAAAAMTVRLIWT